MHGGHYTGRRARLPAVAGCVLALAGCGGLIPQAPLGYLLDRPPPEVALAQGGPSGTLVGGAAPDVPDEAVDGIIGGKLRPWLTFEERKSLAVASERAAQVPTGQTVAWQAHDGDDEPTAKGVVEPVADIYRSLRGGICRDLRQGIDKNGGQHSEQVTLCRITLSDGMTLWSMGGAD